VTDAGTSAAADRVEVDASFTLQLGTDGGCRELAENGLGRVALQVSIDDRRVNGEDPERRTHVEAGVRRPLRDGRKGIPGRERPVREGAHLETFEDRSSSTSWRTNERRSTETSVGSSGSEAGVVGSSGSEAGSEAENWATMQEKHGQAGTCGSALIAHTT
jgi:hypothetical protein